MIRGSLQVWFVPSVTRAPRRNSRCFFFSVRACLVFRARTLSSRWTCRFMASLASFSSSIRIRSACPSQSGSSMASTAALTFAGTRRGHACTPGRRTTRARVAIVVVFVVCRTAFAAPFATSHPNSLQIRTDPICLCQTVKRDPRRSKRVDPGLLGFDRSCETGSKRNRPNETKGRDPRRMWSTWRENRPSRPGNIPGWERGSWRTVQEGKANGRGRGSLE